MRKWQCLALGVAIWSLSLIWPEVNRALAPEVIIKVFVGLGVTMLVYVLERSN